MNYADPATHSFHTTIAPLFSRLQMPSPKIEDGLTYTFAVNDGIRISLVGIQPGFLVIMADVPETIDISLTQRLSRLLAANRLSVEHPAVVAYIDEDHRKVNLWARDYLAMLNEEKLLSLFDRVVRSALALNEWLSLPEAAHTDAPPLSLFDLAV